MKKKNAVKLNEILNLLPYMKISIDEEVEIDENGYYVINVGYLRVSTDKQAEEGYGLDVQEKDVYNYCYRNMFKNLVLFIDDGYTGTNMERPALQAIIKLITDYNSGKSKIKIENFVIPRIDRLGRTLLGTLQFIQDYIVCSKDSRNSVINNNRDDINFISVAENYCRVQKDNPQSKFLLMLFASLAEFDRDLIVQKLYRGKIARIESGKWMGGGIVPYGYKYDRELGILVQVPEEAEVIKEIFRLYIEEKMSPNKIATLLGFKGERIVAQILRRKSLTGCMIYNGKEYPGKHEPIISIERWTEAQMEIEERSVVHTDSHYLLSGLLYCGHCGGKFRYQKWDKKTGEAKILCYSKQKSRPYMVKDENCQSETYWATDIENAVISRLLEIAYKIDDKKVKTQSIFTPIEVILKDLSNTKQKLSKLYDLLDEQDIDDILMEKIAQTRQRQKTLEAMLEDENSKAELQAKVNKVRLKLKEIKTSWDIMTPEERQIVCRSIIEKIIIHTNGTIDVSVRFAQYLNDDQN